MEFVIGLIAALVGSMFIYPALIVAFIILWICVEQNQPGKSMFGTIIIGVLVYFTFPSLVTFLSSPMHIIALLVTYGVVGTSWGFAKWIFKLRKLRTQFTTFRDAYLERNKLAAGYFGGTTYTPAHLNDFVEKIQNKFRVRGGVSGKTIEEVIKAIRPLASEHKSSIIMWIAYWPLSVVWFVLTELLGELANAIYTSVAASLQRISDRMFSNLV